MAKTIMAVGAHIGDAQLTCGMLLAKQAMQGDPGRDRRPDGGRARYARRMDHPGLS